MKNFERYKSFESRGKAFAKFCKRCDKCVLNKIKWYYATNGGTWQCAFAWLELEAEENNDETM